MEYSGGAAECRTQILTASALAGILSKAVGEWVNMVNAPSTAKERGISVSETVRSNGANYASLIRLTVKAEKGGLTLAGAVFEKREPRLVEVDGIPVEALPEGQMLLLWNNDRPGLVGSIGTTLGKHNVNIGALRFGRDAPGGRAITLINVDSEPDADTLAELAKLPNVLAVHTVTL
jgi:D-3-phosphoglycerate dehydrogenase